MNLIVPVSETHSTRVSARGAQGGEWTRRENKSQSFHWEGNEKEGS